MSTETPGNTSERQQVDYLVISAPNLVTSLRVRTQLLAAGLPVRETPLGLEIWCGGSEWRAVLQSLSMMLSACERRDTRLARVGVCDDPAGLHHAIFRAKSVDQLLRELREQWVEQVIAGDAIAIHFQPLIQYPPGRLHGYECLARGADEEGRIISPARLLEAAATVEQLRLFDERCRLAALRQARAFAAAGATFFVNFIPSTISDPQTALAGILDAMAGLLRPEQVVFEVVETDHVEDQRHLADILASFRKAGFRVALDDVGAGYASLLALSQLRPDYMKIDGELLRRATRSALEAKLVADLAETARQNGIIAIAEGIEQEADLRLAIASGIRITQGYFHGRPAAAPLDAGALNAILRRVRDVGQNTSQKDRR